jgi:hypothetical protein
VVECCHHAVGGSFVNEHDDGVKELKHAEEAGGRVLDANASMCGVCDGGAGLWLKWLLWSVCMLLVVAEAVGGSW